MNMPALFDLERGNRSRVTDPHLSQSNASLRCYFTMYWYRWRCCWRYWISYTTWSGNRSRVRDRTARRSADGAGGFVVILLPAGMVTVLLMLPLPLALNPKAPPL